MSTKALDPVLTIRAFAYLTLRSAKNRLLSRLRRAKNPRYALAIVLGAGYLWLVYGRQFSASRSSAAASGTTSAMWLIIGTAFLLVMTSIAWFIPSGPSSLSLDKAEAAFIIPGPVTGRELIGYKLMRAQLAVLMTVLVWTVLLRRGSGALPLGLRAVGVWMFFSTTNLHRTGAEIVRAAWAIRGGGALRKHWAPTAVVIGTIVGLAISLSLGYNAVVAAWHVGFKPGMEAIAKAMGAGPAVVVLWPIHAVLGPMIAADSTQWLAALPAAVVVLALHLVWVFRADDEAVAAAVTRATERMEQIRVRTKQRVTSGVAVRPKPDMVLPTMPLASTGWPAMAIIWKNTLGMRRKTKSVLWVMMFALAAPLVFAVIAMVEGGGGSVAVTVGVLALVIASILLLVGPMILRTDLRDDMLHLVALKLIPLPGRTIVAAEVLSVVAPLALVQWVLVSMAAIASLFADHHRLGLGETVALLASALPTLIVFNAAFVAIQNAAPVLFPAWTKLGALTSGGMEAMGQMIIVVGLVLVLLVLMLIAPATIAGGIIYVGQSHLSLALLVGLGVGSAVLAGEVYALIAILGRTLERTEPSDVTT